MVTPLVSPRMKQLTYLLRVFIPFGRGNSLISIAGGAGKSKIIQAVIAPRRPWLNMLDFKGEVEDVFRSAAVFTPPVGPFRYALVKRVHDFTGVMAFVRAIVASNVASISPSNSARSSTVSDS